MKSIRIYLLGFIMSVAASAQTQPASDNYFPSITEISELQTVASNLIFDNPADLSQLTHGALISDVGFRSYARRTYSLGSSKSLSIEVVSLMDMKAAYSLLTLSGGSIVQPGAPGDEYSFNANGIQFAQRNQWVVIQGRGVSADLIKRAANAVSNRIGPLQPKRPELISHFPKTDYNASTLKYFPGFKPFETYSKRLPEWIHSCGQDMEIAQANYTVNSATGALSLLSFPTSQMAEVCYAKLAKINAGKFYIKTAGPLVAILEGSMEPVSAGKLLDSIKYEYDVQWIYEKKESKSSNLFGIPVSVVGKLVKKSLFFVIVIAVISIGAGFMFALFRFRLRSRLSISKLEDDITHLRM
jgi:hypothetical protein